MGMVILQIELVYAWVDRFRNSVSQEKHKKAQKKRCDSLAHRLICRFFVFVPFCVFCGYGSYLATFGRFGSSTTGRTSTVPKRAAGMRLAIEMASLRSLASTMK